MNKEQALAKLQEVVDYMASKTPEELFEDMYEKSESFRRVIDDFEVEALSANACNIPLEYCSPEAAKSKKMSENIHQKIQEFVSEHADQLGE